VPFGREEGEIVITAGGAAWITNAYATLVVFGVALLSVTVMVNEYVPLNAGVPASTPLAPRLNPCGRVPAVTL
jgi:hypothetical protein